MTNSPLAHAQSTNNFVDMQQIFFYAPSYKLFCNMSRMDNIDLSTYGKRLQYAMTRASVGQAQLARLINVKQQNIGYLIKRGHGSSHTTAICNALKINADWLTRGVGSMTSYDAMTDKKNELGKKQTLSSADHAISSRYSVIIGCIEMHKSDPFLITTKLYDAPQQQIMLSNLPTHAITYQIRGSDMQPALFNGWIVSCDPDAALQHGELTLVKLKNGQMLVGIFAYQTNGALTLQALKTQIPQTFDLNDIDHTMPVISITMPSQATTIN
jgi:hypothetical protein